MRMVAMTLVVTVLAGAAPVHAGECAQQLQDIERRMQSAGSSDIAGPTPTTQAQRPSVATMELAQSLIKIGKAQDAAGNQLACEKTVADIQAKVGVRP